MARRKTQDPEQPKVKLTKEKLKDAARIFRFIRPYRFAFGFGLVLLFLSSLTFMVFPYLSGLMVDIAQGEQGMEIDLGDVGWILAIVLVVQGGVSYLRIYLFAIVSEKGIADVRRALYEKLITMPMTFFEESRVGELVSRLTSDVEKLYNAFSITLAEFLRQIIILVAGIIFLAFRAPTLSLIMLGTFPVVIIGAMFFGRFIRKLSKERQEELAESNNILNETMQAIQAVKSFTNELFESLRYGKRIERVVGMSLKYARWRALFTVFIVTFLFGALFFIIWQGASLVQSGEMTVGLLIEFVAYTAIIGGSIAGLGNFYTELLGAIGATERIREILDETAEVSIRAHGEAPAHSFEGRIAYESVHFRYPTRPDIEVLKGLSFSVEPGQKVALVGTSGAGKSTIVQLLLRYYGLQGGEIKVDGQPISSYDITAYRKNMAIVPQEVILFGGSIRENIAYGKPGATEEEITEAARQANAWSFISGFPEGLDTLVGERGVKLSGGQRQRIAIARAILKDPAILLLDEATSSLDAESEKAVQDALNTLMEGRTSIIIAHRLATIRDVDQIFVIDDGRIIEQGTHTELSAREDGAYNTLAKLQFEPIQ
ncbi:ABC transporter ATP-binding protein [Phaeodactylibacter luteus]|uniref:ATP-binding cassette domain-containing protein n=1 Tax=Phaeodactylibacter luteus TaxID=1564516 RepID=A0A5C6RK42_9BACT|nr:ABC transporter transmembrane domain-containing protein [Phaeodactylibacter luteus]TXB62741.1 ATP-binding cassette domain-containing protein [Phaeodactylibacter luteus]